MWQYASMHAHVLNICKTIQVTFESCTGMLHVGISHYGMSCDGMLHVGMLHVWYKL